MSATTYGRETVQIIEISQPRCVNRFGTSPCTATGTPKCYQTYWTCKDTPNYNPTGFISWRFCRPQDRVDWLYAEDSANEIYTNAQPTVMSVSTTSSAINIGSIRDGESPLGTRATCRISLQDTPWDDHVGDFYLADRTLTQPRPGFWAMWKARNPFYPGAQVRIYEGYRGQALAVMQVRLYDLENVEGPDSSGRVTITGRDPLDKARAKKAKFPATSDIDLAADIGADDTDISVTCAETELSADFGNTGSLRYIVIGSEIISYTGWTGTAPDLTLTGVTRGVLGSVKDDHSADDAVQRGGRYVGMRLYEVAEDLLKAHTEVPDAYVNAGGQWDAEGDDYLANLTCDTFISEPTSVEDLLGELCRDGLFAIWWDERKQTIPMIAVKPPQETPGVWTDDNNFISDSIGISEKPDERLTRVTIFFGQRDPTADLEDDANYRNRRISIDGEAELEDATGGQIIEKVIYSRWLRTFGQALLVGGSMLLRFRLIPKYLTVTVDAKDRDASIGDVFDIETRYLLDSEGNLISTRWQVIEIDEPRPSETAKATLQSYRFVGKFAVIMANTAPDYASATDAEKLNGCWLSDDDPDLMPDGSAPYLLQ